MNVSDIKKALMPWIKVDTWTSGHPLDDKRFHQALSALFRDHGYALDGSEIAEAMTELTLELYPNWNEEHLNNEIDRYSLRAEHIASYLSDTRGT